MRRMAIVGSGIVGLAAAHGLRRAGYPVTLYSDRTAEQWLTEARPTGTAGRFGIARAFEQELGLNHWDELAPRGEGIFLTFCPTLHKPLLRLFGRIRIPFQAIDVRLQSSRWMGDFERIGGKIVVEPVTPARLDEIAGEHDLTIVAAGRADLCKLFPRDERRSVYTAPQRNLAMVVARSPRTRIDGCPFLPVKFDFLGTDGEAFFVPYWHKDHGVTWNLLFEAKPGSRMDRFNDVASGEEALAVAKRLLHELFPWNDAFMRDMELADPNGWLAGRVTPTVRAPFARLASGRVVTALGDTAISFDPIAAQGANTGMKHARHLLKAVMAHGVGAFDEQWMTSTFESFWDEHARHAYTFSNLLLEPLTAGAKELLIAQYGSDGVTENAQQRIADAFMENFNDPRQLTPCFTSHARARAFITKTTGRSWFFGAVRGRAAIARDQLFPARATAVGELSEVEQ